MDVKAVVVMAVLEIAEESVMAHVQVDVVSDVLEVALAVI